MSTEPFEDSALEKRLRHAREELTRRLRAGDPCLAEDLLAAEPELGADSEAALELIFTEYTVRDELGQDPSHDDYYRRFPSWRDRLERLFDIHRMVRAESQASFSNTMTDVAGEQAATVFPGRRVGGYELLEEIGRGGMGVVYRARQVGLNRLVAVKMILAGAHAGPEQRERFRKEAEAAARLDHPGIVRIHEVGEHDGLPYLSMELVEGGGLDRLLGERDRQGAGLLAAEQAAELVESLARAVHYAHQKGVIHRDLKPANVLIAACQTSPTLRVSGSLTPTRSVSETAVAESAIKITDFGLAKILDDLGEQTRTGALLGTPVYMAPEQAGGLPGAVGPAIDIHALGVILYELLTGRPPYEGASVEETLELVRAAEPVPPRQLRTRLPHNLETICLKCLRKEPGRRYPSAEALADDLRRFQEGQPIRARPASVTERGVRWVRRHPTATGLVAALATLITVALVVITSLWREAETRRKEAERKAAEGERPNLQCELADLDLFLGLRTGDTRQMGLTFSLVVVNGSTLPNAVLAVKVWVKQRDGTWQELERVSVDPATPLPLNLPARQTASIRLTGQASFPHVKALEQGGNKALVAYRDHYLADPREIKIELKGVNNQWFTSIVSYEKGS